jgi:hypothetical protein
MPWSRKFPVPVTLDSGRSLTTLREAANFVLGLPERHQRNDHWQSAAEALMKAATDGSNNFQLEAAEERLIAALRAEGVLERKRRR